MERGGGRGLTPSELGRRIGGGLFGCAVGDALGAPYEGLWAADIPPPDALLSGFGHFEGYPPGQVTDDTQLSLATVEAILEADAVEPAAIARRIAALFASFTVVGPGGACMEAADRILAGGDWRRSGAPVGSAGNGAAMRAAVVGLAFIGRGDALPEAAADVARITHKDPRSIAGGVAIAAARLLAEDLAVPEVLAALPALSAPYDRGLAEELERLPELLEREDACALDAIARAGQASYDFDRPIITPFVVPTVLAALWAVGRWPDSWPEATTGAIRLGGDVDTLGAITGALMGARLGLSAIPKALRATVINADAIAVLAARFAVWVEGRQAMGGSGGV